MRSIPGASLLGNRWSLALMFTFRMLMEKFGLPLMGPICIPKCLVARDLPLAPGSYPWEPAA
jgi:hypothetical protein